ncbi:Glutamate receptor ionotropic, kainate 2 [Folsomia candida]|uniref:Glutamate receptor ionotropic, kainate 2 n=2 Tax=Folsomia candida TaxID=158441 RepID=A0A226EJN0_FOLCA|nr:Glutamate receptor ionotropic, kainate 2 [Folsomia candida]
MKWMEKIALIQKYFLPSPISYRRQNIMEGVNVAAVAQNDPDYQPRIRTIIHSNGSAEFVAGMCLEVLDLLQFLLKFSYTAIDGKGWMGIFPNGTWTGQSGQVVNEEADFSISQASTIMMLDQIHGITFLHSTSTGTLVAIFRQPHLSSIRDIILTVFHPYLWLCYLLVWTILLICLKIMFNVLKHHEMILPGDAKFIKDSPLMLWAISATANLGWNMTPISSSIRLIFMIGFFLAACMYIAYSASMVTNLSTETIPVKNSKDLADSSIEIFADKWLPMTHKVMENMYRERHVDIQNLDAFTNQLEFIIPDLMNRSWAFITFSDAISVVFHRLNFTDVVFCQTIYSVVASKVLYPNAMYVKRGSPIREILNTRILLLIERGFLSRLNRFYDRETQILCLHQNRAYRGGLTMRDTITPFFFIFFGSIASLLILILERNFKRKTTFDLNK